MDSSSKETISPLPRKGSSLRECIFKSKGVKACRKTVRPVTLLFGIPTNMFVLSCKKLLHGSDVELIQL